MLRFDSVHVSYPSSDGVRNILNGITCEIHEGEFVTVIGETGSGKTTLLRLALGQEKPSSGHVLMQGQEIVEPDRSRGYVPQKYSLFPDKTVLDNVTFGLEVQQFSLAGMWTPRFFSARKKFRQEGMEHLLRMGLRRPDARKYPDQLSGGMQQRVAIAQALITRPRMLLMDEAFSALDPRTRTGMQDLLLDLWRESGMTIMFVTHNISEAVYLSSRVIALSKTYAGADPEHQGSRIVLDKQLPRTHGPEFRESSEFTRAVIEVEAAMHGCPKIEEPVAVS